MGDFKGISIVDTAPPSITHDSRIIGTMEALDREIKEIYDQKGYLHIIKNIDNMPEEIINLLAWQWHIDFWDTTLPLAIKRQLVKNSIPWHRRKGTPSAVKEIVSTIFGWAIVKEWFEYGGKPYYFRVETTDTVQDPRTFDRLIQLINTVKNTRSWLESIRLTHEKILSLTIGIATHSVSRLKFYPQSKPASQKSIIIISGIALHSATHLKIYPRLSDISAAIPISAGISTHMTTKTTIYSKEET